jgi:arylsulfatase A-like enzyme
MPKKTNIILITIDSLRADHCGWLNPENKELTPFLNELAQESLIFTNAYATGPSTCFSFPGILTGTYPLSFEGWDKKTFPALEQRPYLPEILQKNGYQTMAVLDCPFLSSFFGYDRGFDTFRDLGAEHHDFQNRQVPLKNNQIPPFLERCFLKLNQYNWYFTIKDFLYKKFNKFYYPFKYLILKIRRKFQPSEFEREFESLSPFIRPSASGKLINEVVCQEMNFVKEPWFLWVHYMDTHHPFSPPKEVPPLNISKMAIKRALHAYRRSIEFGFPIEKEDVEILKKLYRLRVRYLDENLKAFFNKLKEKIENSIIVITADHGEELGEEGRFGHSSKLIKELLRVPLLIITPAQKGKIINDIISAVQIPATILKLVGITPPSEMEASLFDKKKVKVYSESMSSFSPLFDWFDLTTKQKIEINTLTFPE